MSKCGNRVALRKESVDRNGLYLSHRRLILQSLSARRAWIEIYVDLEQFAHSSVALRKESVDRNGRAPARAFVLVSSLSARRAWIEIADR